jgi:hypothetical protein
MIVFKKPVCKIEVGKDNILFTLEEGREVKLMFSDRQQVKLLRALQDR